MTLPIKEQQILDAIKHNHQAHLEKQMDAHAKQFFNETHYDSTTLALIEKLGDIRVLSNHYLDTLIEDEAVATEENQSPISKYFTGIAAAVLPERFFKSIFTTYATQFKQSISPFTSNFFSIMLGDSITGVLLEYYIKEFSKKDLSPQEAFNEIIEKQTDLSDLIKQSCKATSAELIKLFHFREMLLLGKVTHHPLEPNARANFINQEHLEKESSARINELIELYFIRELNAIFNRSFQSLYKIQDLHIKTELSSPVRRWLNQLFESYEKRVVFTQEIQLKFMSLSSDFLLQQMNSPSFLGRHPIVSAVLLGLALFVVLTIPLAFTLSIFLGVTIALVGAVLGAVGFYFGIYKSEYLYYERSGSNRAHLQESINMVNSELLSLKNENNDIKDTAFGTIKNTSQFESTNKSMTSFNSHKHIARGSVGSWLRDYASRYRHSSAIEVDLGNEYKELMEQSIAQSESIVKAINEGHQETLAKWLKNTQAYLKEPANQALIQELELAEKVKEQVFEIVGQIKYIPPGLHKFYCSSVSEGGLGGNAADFAHFQRLAPKFAGMANQQNPYLQLCDVALNLFKNREPHFKASPLFLGDAEYRKMLGISRSPSDTPLTSESVDQYLANSYTFLLSLCNPIKPGLGINPLIQDAQVSDEFILYRMLLLKQLADLCRRDNQDVNNEVKRKIKNFVEKNFNKNPSVIFDDLVNQQFLVNKEVQTSQTYTNSDGFAIAEVELNNIVQAIGLDIAYNSIPFKLQDVLDGYIAKDAELGGNKTSEYFGHINADSSLNPRCTDEYAQIINRFCTHTDRFINNNAQNEVLKTTHILECYRYNVSLNVYSIQLRILKLLGEHKHFAKNGNEMELLVSSFQQLEQFSRKNCYALHKNSPIERAGILFKAKTSLKEVIKDVDLSDVVAQIHDLPNQFHQPLSKLKLVKKPFFKEEKKQEAAGSTVELTM